tara:strand:+ start:606 stop:1463 length:858 start_codon:yes stop_codon:yes gene_type:complete
MNSLKQIGKWKVSVIETGSIMLDGGAMMGSVPKVLWEEDNAPDDLNRIKLSMRCLLLDDGKNLVLIETGIGNKFSRKFKQMFNIKVDILGLSNTLSKLGYSHLNITHVVLTHLHFDHAGGATILNKSGNIIPAFPNAKYYVSEKNWIAGNKPNPKDRASYLEENFKVLQTSGSLVLIPDNFQILNGISTYIVNGHTNGQQLVKIEGGSETLVFCSDLIPLKSHLKLPWIMGYDLNASLTLIEKEKFLNLASDKDWILFFYHDPKTIAVKIRKNNHKYIIKDEYSA